jgi:hypothetical protein
MAEQELPGGWLPPQAPHRPGEEPPAPPLAVPPPVQPEGTSALGVTALVCAVTSIGLVVFSLGLSFALSLPLAITGWVCASRTERPGAGRVISIVAVGVSVVAALVWVALMLAGYSPEELQRSLEHELERQRQSS